MHVMVGLVETLVTFLDQIRAWKGLGLVCPGLVCPMELYRNILLTDPLVVNCQ